MARGRRVTVAFFPDVKGADILRSLLSQSFAAKRLDNTTSYLCRNVAPEISTDLSL